MTRWASEDLVGQAIRGDANAVERLITAVWPSCFRLAASLIGDYNLAQDAAQEACVIVHRKVKNLRSAQAFDTWLYRVVTREASRVRRRNVAPAPPYERGFTLEPGVGIDVWRALADLAPQQREVTVLFYFDDLKTEDIALILGVPHATVRTRLARARERLRHILGDYDVEPQASTKEVTQHAC